MGIETHFTGNEPPSYYSMKMLNYSPSLAKSLSQMVKEEEECDVYVVMADECLPVINELPGKKMSFISQGDWSLVYIIRHFEGREKAYSRIMETRFVPNLRKHAALAKKFNLILANSQFTANLVSFLYGIPISGVVYPPVDRDVFRPISIKKDQEGPYALTILRNNSDPLYAYVKHLAGDIKIKVVGRGRLEGAENLGFVSDSELVELYSGARVTLSPNTREFYGYSIVESMSCGTPTLAFKSAGAAELLRDQYNGWLVDNLQGLRHAANTILHESQNQAIRENCVQESLRFGIRESTTRLLEFLDKLAD